MYQRQKNEKTEDIQRILEDFKGVRNIPGIKSAKKKVLTKIKNEKGKSSRLEKGLPMSLENSTNKFATTMKKENLNLKSRRMKMRAASMCMTTTPMR